MAVLVSDWRGEKLPRATATASVGSRWQLELSKVLGTVSGGSAVLADGEVVRAAFRVARLSGYRLLRVHGGTVKCPGLKAGLRRFHVAGRDFPVATAPWR